jgi:hypothetical protein
MFKLKTLDGTMGTCDSDCLGLDQGCKRLGHDEVDGFLRQVLMPYLELGVHMTVA